jgi:hypothetical protein
LAIQCDEYRQIRDADIRKRKNANDKHFAQLVRLMKFWCKLRKAADDGFRFKSFMVELIVAHLADRGTPLGDYPSARPIIFDCDRAERDGRYPQTVDGSSWPR